ncbi:MAG: hypothetical protein ABSH41_32800 [Syntrophobacteraceae bacterium]
MDLQWRAAPCMPPAPNESIHDGCLRHQQETREDVREEFIPVIHFSAWRALLKLVDMEAGT